MSAKDNIRSIDEGFQFTIAHVNKDLEALDKRIDCHRWEGKDMAAKLVQAEDKYHRLMDHIEILEANQVCFWHRWWRQKGSCVTARARRGPPLNRWEVPSSSLVPVLMGLLTGGFGANPNREQGWLQCQVRGSYCVIYSEPVVHLLTKQAGWVRSDNQTCHQLYRLSRASDFPAITC